MADGNTSDVGVAAIIENVVPRSTVVLVPGGWHGGWAYEAVVPRLTAHGHTAHALTLGGLGPAPAEHANLETHVEQVVEAIRALDTRVVLAGHSYAGIVITGVADRVPDLIEHLVYIDAYVPASGDTCWTLTSDKFRAFITTGAVEDGRTVAVPRGLDPRARAHPVACFLQSLELCEPPAAARIRRSYVFAGPWPGSPFVEVADRLRTDPAWTVHDLPVGHDVMNGDPDGLVRVLLN